LESREENEGIEIKFIINDTKRYRDRILIRVYKKPMVSGMYLYERVTFKLP